MRVDMKKIEIWLEEKILYFLSTRGGRMQRMNLVTTLSTASDRNWNWSLLIAEQPGWAHVGEQKRQHRIDKLLSRMVREHKIKICNESGDPTFSEDYTRYVYKISLLDRIACHLEDDDV